VGAFGGAFPKNNHLLTKLSISDELTKANQSKWRSMNEHITKVSCASHDVGVSSSSENRKFLPDFESFFLFVRAKTAQHFTLPNMQNRLIRLIS